ncbi:MAG: hypothetical protein QMD03_08910 [Syntrophales bacterium]|nr:hypothetical protein [Syntrophales bacterium]
MRSLIKGVRLPVVLALFSIIVIAIPALAEEKDRPRAELSVAVLSQYIWRGQELTRNSIVVQPSITVAYKGFYVNLWSNLDTEPYSRSDANYSTTWTETDFKLAYSKNLGLVKVEAGYGYYGMSAPNPDAPDLPDTQDIFLELGLNTLLSPTFSISKDVSHDHQWYLLLEISHAFQFTRTVSLNPTT